MKKSVSYSNATKLLTYIGNFISVLSGILTILSYLGYNAYSQNLYIILVFIFAGLMILSVTFRNRIASFLMIKLLNLTAPTTENIEIYDKIIEYKYLSREVLSFRSEFKIKVLNQPIDHIEDKIKWTAGNISRIKPLIKGQDVSIVSEPNMQQLSFEKQLFSIKFAHDRKFGKNDDLIKTGFIIDELNDKDHKAKPILMAGVYNMTKNLKLMVAFNPVLKPIGIRFMSYAHFIDSTPYETIQASYKINDSTGEKYVEFNIERPIYGGKYVIDWEFDE